LTVLEILGNTAEEKQNLEAPRTCGKSTSDIKNICLSSIRLFSEHFSFQKMLRVRLETHTFVRHSGPSTTKTGITRQLSVKAFYIEFKNKICPTVKVLTLGTRQVERYGLKTKNRYFLLYRAPGIHIKRVSKEERKLLHSRNYRTI
jgi:hypothetical protein